MAIDAMKRVTLLCPVGTAKRLLRALHQLGVMELRDSLELSAGMADHLTRQEPSTEESDRHLLRTNFILNLLDTHAPAHKGFFEGLAPVPLLVDSAELDEAVEKFDLEGAYTRAQELEEAQRHAERSLAECQAELAGLLPFEDIPYKLGELAALKHMRTCFGWVPVPAMAALAADPEAGAVMAWDVVAPGKAMRRDQSGEQAAAKADTSRMVFVFLREDEEAARRILAARGVEELPLPRVPGKVRDRIRELREDIQTHHQRLAQIAAEVRELAPWRRPVSVLKGFWESNRQRSLAAGQTAHGKWVQVLTGYVRAADLPRLERVLPRDFPDVSLLVEDPASPEDVPVSVSLPPLVRPIRMLVSMFGLPYYSAFDPSPFILGNFLLFFGICFGDVGYGLMLMLTSAYLMRKTREYDSLYNFARLLLYAGIATTVCGLFLGSWFGDLPKPEYLGEGNPLYRVQQRFLVLDALEKPVLMLGVSLVIGMLNQFYGIGLKMYGCLRARDWQGAVFDGLLWLITLPGMALLVSKVFAPVPQGLFRLGAVMAIGGAIGLVLTQGRGEKTLLGKAITGVVSLYGIVGSYGCTAFLGDTLSYCRLLALGLTTSIVALSINMMAGMLREVPVAGPVLFVLLLVAGHVFNFAINLLGSFVHSMRLIFVEFFGRFYSGGAKPFRPLSINTDSFVLRRPAETTGG